MKLFVLFSNSEKSGKLTFTIYKLTINKLWCIFSISKSFSFFKEFPCCFNPDLALKTGEWTLRWNKIENMEKFRTFWERFKFAWKRSTCNVMIDYLCFYKNSHDKKEWWNKHFITSFMFQEIFALHFLVILQSE